MEKPAFGSIVRVILAISGMLATQGHAQTAFVTGQVTDSRTGAAVAGASVSIGHVTFSNFNQDQSTTTDQDGRYQFEVSVSNSLAVRVYGPPPLLPTFWPWQPCLVDLCRFEGNNYISVQSGETFVADVVLSPPGSVSGRVFRDDNGSPLSDVIVQAQWLQTPEFQHFLLKGERTGPNGDYQIDGLPAGEYRISNVGEGLFVAEVYDDVPCEGSCLGPTPGETPVSVVAEAVQTDVDMRLAAASTISGFLTDNANPQSLVRAFLVLRRWTDQGWVHAGNTPALNSPEFVFSGLRAGTYVIGTSGCSSCPGYVHEVYNDRACLTSSCSEAELAAGDPIVVDVGESATIEIGLEPAASVSGCVTDAVTALPIADVAILAYRREVFPFVYADTVNAAHTGSDGCYRIDYLPGYNNLRLRSVNTAGYVDEVFDDIGCLGGACDLFAGDVFGILHDQDLSGFDMALVQGASISGIVVPQSGGALPVDLRFNLYDSQGTQIRRSDADLPIESDGRFRSYGLADGVYFLTARAGERLYVYGAEPSPEMPFPVLEGTPITIANGRSVNRIVFELLGPVLLADGFESD